MAGNNTEVVSMTDILFGSEWSVDRTISFMNQWVPTSYKIVAGYLCMVYFGQKMMRNREAFHLEGLLALWNLCFSFFSGLATYKLAPELFWSIRNLGIVVDRNVMREELEEFFFEGSYCENAEYYLNPSTGWWGWMFVMSKAPELGDTLFLILRKRPVIFVHWYHHALTFLYAQITYSELQAWCRWSLALNLAVHTVMYFYFAIRAMHFKTPRYVAKFITSIQIIQFIINVIIFAHLFYIKYYGTVPSCNVTWNVLSIGGLMYLSYLYLFMDFFYNAYIVRKPVAKVQEVQPEVAHVCEKKTLLPSANSVSAKKNA
uniref:Elongation of very long chain fatty acids protein n=1 Tax=Syphacia muris TaxID=451379 RepID=A0A158R498_9BILA